MHFAPFGWLLSVFKTFIYPNRCRISQSSGSSFLLVESMTQPTEPNRANKTSNYVKNVKRDKPQIHQPTTANARNHRFYWSSLTLSRPKQKHKRNNLICRSREATLFVDCGVVLRKTHPTQTKKTDNKSLHACCLS